MAVPAVSANVKGGCNLAGTATVPARQRSLLLARDLTLRLNTIFRLEHLFDHDS